MDRRDTEEEEIKFVEHVFTNISPSPDPEHPEQQHVEPLPQDMQAINQNERDYGTDTSEITNEPDSDHNEAFMEPTEVNTSLKLFLLTFRHPAPTMGQFSRSRQPDRSSCPTLPILPKL